MKTFIIGQVRINDPVRYEDYKKLTVATLQPYGGKFIVRGGAREVLDGEWSDDRIVVLEFPSKEQAKAWFTGDVYATAKAIRESASTGRFILLEGVE